MFEARFDQGAILKKIVDAVKELVNDANLECSGSGISLQAMDSSHVSLVALSLKAEGFAMYRCDRNISLGVQLTNVNKVLKCAGNDDAITLKAEDDGDALSLLFENESNDRTAEFNMKLMDIDQEHLGIPETEYKCLVKMPSAEFQRIVRDMMVIGDTCTIAVLKDSVRFSGAGDLGSGSIVRKQNTASDKPEERTSIDVDEPTELTFALQYLNNFARATSLSPTVSLHLSKEVPLMVEYKVENFGHMRFYLAPKIDEEASS